MSDAHDQSFRQAGVYLAHLIRCGLADVPADPLPEGTTWQQVHALAARSSVEGVSWFGARTRDDVPSDLRAQWEEEANRTLFRRLSFDVERERVLAAMDARGLAHLPLKGILVAGYYPRPEMRSMADNDILYGFVEPCATGGFQVRGATEEARGRTVREATAVMADLMRGLGYKAESLSMGNHDSFHKEPLFNFEMHRQLMSASSPLYASYANPWARARQSEKDPLAFFFSDEDEYVYLLAHAFKHFDVSGCGIRFVVDVYVFLERKGAGLDWDYVARELSHLGLVDFEAKTRALAQDAFGTGELTDADCQLLWYLLGCGTYGNMRVRIEREVARLGSEGAAPRRRYVCERIFMDEGLMREFYPTFWRHRWLRPLLPLFRVGKSLVRHPGKLVQEAKILLRLGQREGC